MHREKKKKFYLTAIVAFWTAAVFAIVWGAVSQLTEASSAYTISFLGQTITLNRWVDTLFVSVLITTASAVLIWLLPRMEKLHSDKVVHTIFFFRGIFAGAITGVGVTLVYAATTDFDAVITAGMFISMGAFVVSMAHCGEHHFEDEGSTVRAYLVILPLGGMFGLGIGIGIVTDFLIGLAFAVSSILAICVVALIGLAAFHLVRHVASLRKTRYDAIGKA